MQRTFAALLLALSTAATAAEPAAVPEPPRWPAGVSGAGEDPTPESPGEGDVTITEDERGKFLDYMTKPVDSKDFERLLQTVQDYWRIAQISPK